MLPPVQQIGPDCHDRHYVFDFTVCLCVCVHAFGRPFVLARVKTFPTGLLLTLVFCNNLMQKSVSIILHYYVQHNNGIMCGIKLKDRFPSKELRERLGIDDIALVLQQNKLRWYGHVLRKEDDDWVKKCMEYEVKGPRPRGIPKRTWREAVEKDSST